MSPFRADDGKEYYVMPVHPDMYLALQGKLTEREKWAIIRYQTPISRQIKQQLRTSNG
jgi:hypothetical protein